MLDILPELGGKGICLRDWKNSQHRREDMALLKNGILDPKGFVSGYMPVKNPVEVRVYDAGEMRKLSCDLHGPYLDGSGAERAHWTYHGQRVHFDEPRYARALKAVRRQHNLRTTQGRDNWQRLLMGGNIAANSQGFTGVSGTATSSPSSTGLVNSGAAFPTTGGPNTGLQGQVVWFPVAGVYGVITSVTNGTTLVVNQWTNVASATGAAGTTPSNGAAYIISPGCGPAQWVGLSTNSAAAAAGDICRTSDGQFGDGSSGGASTEQTGSGLARAFIQTTFPGAGQFQFGAFTFTYTGSSSVTIAKGVLCNTNAVAGTLLFLETLLSATATVTASGDTIVLTWTISL